MLKFTYLGLKKVTIERRLKGCNCLAKGKSTPRAVLTNEFTQSSQLQRESDSAGYLICCLAAVLGVALPGYKPFHSYRLQTDGNVI